MISTLTSREADIVRMYFGLEGGDPQTLEQIGKCLQLTRERVRQIKAAALKRLRGLKSLCRQPFGERRKKRSREHND